MTDETEPRTMAGLRLQKVAREEWADVTTDVLAIEAQMETENALALAVLDWFDTTHGNGFGHDHHCPVRDDPKRTFTAEPDDRCTCGWTAVLRAQHVRYLAEQEAAT